MAGGGRTPSEREGDSGVRILRRSLVIIAALMMVVGGWTITTSTPAGAATCEPGFEVEHHIRLSNSAGPSDLCLPDFLNGTDLRWCDSNFDGDDPVWVDTTTAQWIDYNTGNIFNYGRPGDFPVCGDWDGDGRDGIGVVRTVGGGLTWFLRNSISGGSANLQFSYGRANDFPLAGDYNADGRDTPGVRRGNVWFLRNANSGGSANLQFGYGTSSDFPFVGDYNGDGRDTAGVTRGATWLLRNSNSAGAANVQFAYGRADELFQASADFLGLGVDTPHISRLVAPIAQRDAADVPDWTRTRKP
jgi:hypothetical protein